MITYMPPEEKFPVVRLKVYLEKKHIGDIKEVMTGRFQYFPKGHKIGGAVFTTIYGVQASLEVE